MSKPSFEAQISPPKAPRSAFICFSDSIKKEITERRDKLKTKDILKLVADDWKKLSPRERAYWDEEARNDKVRYVREKAEYKGPWNIPKRRAKKHPMAPKRPMSAFLKFSQKTRKEVKMNNPDMSNTDVSRLLGEMWRNASARTRAPFVEEELRERANYKEVAKAFRDKLAKEDAASRTSHEAAMAAEPIVEVADSSLFEPFAVSSEGFTVGNSVFRKPAPIGDSTNRHQRQSERMLERSKQDRHVRPYAMMPPPPPPPPAHRDPSSSRYFTPYFVPQTFHHPRYHHQGKIVFRE